VSLADDAKVEGASGSTSQTPSGRSSRTGSLSKARARVAEGLKSPMLGVKKLDEIRESFNKGVEVK
jgi:hypothetical protein